MKTNTVRKIYMSNERVLALDEFLPKKSTQYDSSPGIYARSDKDKELDILWQDSRISSKDEKSPLIYLSAGFAVGIVSMLVMTFLFNFGNPSKDNLAELDMWKKASTKSAVVSVTPSSDEIDAVIEPNAQYNVKNGDTLEKIAYRFYGSKNPSKITTIQIANNLKSPHLLRIGQKLTIPMNN